MQNLLKYFAILTLLSPIIASAFTVPANPTGFVNDYAGMLTAEQVQTLEAKLEVYEKNTTNEIAVVTIPSLDGDVIENVAQEIFTKWGIGKADKNNGVLLLISLSDRKTRIQTGYGVEGNLTDIATSYIQSDIITPAFRNGDYYDGINGAVDKMIEALGGNAIVPPDYGNQYSNIPWQFIIFGFFIVLQILTSILGQSKSWWGGGVLGGVVSLIIWHFFISSIFLAVPVIFSLIGLGLLFDFIVSRAYTEKRNTGRFPLWFFWGGGGGGRGGGGGFGGFGGGGSGGGGSSGGW